MPAGGPRAPRRQRAGAHWLHGGKGRGGQRLHGDKGWGAQGAPGGKKEGGQGLRGGTGREGQGLRGGKGRDARGVRKFRNPSELRRTKPHPAPPWESDLRALSGAACKRRQKRSHDETTATSAVLLAKGGHFALQST